VASLDVTEKTKTATTKQAKETKDVVTEQEALNAQWDIAVGNQVELKKSYEGLVGAAGLFRAELEKLNKEEAAAAAAKTSNVARQFLRPDVVSAAGRGPSAAVDEAKLKLLELQNATKSSAEGINAAIMSLALDSLTGFASAFGEALVSGDVAGGIMKFAGILGGAVSALGKQVIAVSTTMKTLQTALSTGAFAGGLGIAAGIGLVIAGAALTSLANGGLKLARGGVVNGPTQALIGEGGPEVAIPLSQLANIIGGVAMQISGGSGNGNLSIVRGQDIYYSNNNASRSFGRLFG
jgi:hypothetical protein